LVYFDVEFLELGIDIYFRMPFHMPLQGAFLGEKSVAENAMKLGYLIAFVFLMT